MYKILFFTEGAGNCAAEFILMYRKELKLFFTIKNKGFF